MHYRIYFIDRQDHIRSAQDLAAENDAEATHRASSFSAGHCVEVWQGARQVSRIEPEARQTP